jgi:hypothetical protein
MGIPEWLCVYAWHWLAHRLVDVLRADHARSE